MPQYSVKEVAQLLNALPLEIIDVVVRYMPAKQLSDVISHGAILLTTSDLYGKYFLSQAQTEIFKRNTQEVRPLQKGLLIRAFNTVQANVLTPQLLFERMMPLDFDFNFRMAMLLENNHILVSASFLYIYNSDFSLDEYSIALIKTLLPFYSIYRKANLFLWLQNILSDKSKSEIALSALREWGAYWTRQQKTTLFENLMRLAENMNLDREIRKNALESLAKLGEIWDNDSLILFSTFFINKINSVSNVGIDDLMDAPILDVLCYDGIMHFGKQKDLYFPEALHQLFLNNLRNGNKWTQFRILYFLTGPGERLHLSQVTSLITAIVDKCLNNEIFGMQEMSLKSLASLTRGLRINHNLFLFNKIRATMNHTDNLDRWVIQIAAIQLLGGSFTQWSSPQQIIILDHFLEKLSEDISMVFRCQLLESLGLMANPSNHIQIKEALHDEIMLPNVMHSNVVALKSLGFLIRYMNNEEREKLFLDFFPILNSPDMNFQLAALDILIHLAGEMNNKKHIAQLLPIVIQRLSLGNSEIDHYAIKIYQRLIPFLDDTQRQFLFSKLANSSRPGILKIRSSLSLYADQTSLDVLGHWQPIEGALLGFVRDSYLKTQQACESSPGSTVAPTPM